MSLVGAKWAQRVLPLQAATVRQDASDSHLTMPRPTAPHIARSLLSTAWARAAAQQGHTSATPTQSLRAGAPLQGSHRNNAGSRSRPLSLSSSGVHSTGPSHFREPPAPCCHSRASPAAPARSNISCGLACLLSKIEPPPVSPQIQPTSLSESSGRRHFTTPSTALGWPLQSTLTLGGFNFTEGRFSVPFCHRGYVAATGCFGRLRSPGGSGSRIPLLQLLDVPGVHFPSCRSYIAG
ncbi:hypothetical protein NDU88_004741 [Pleurodeles waltl]|uniref:Uncharacterized protein n=1 Tax=Pleurodeles waltl TaxID=8319 RepID=A0AAV7PIE3_PLEWA|nr:hypothetical protein NDU88_004741 [Pleurodeles waltl]